MTTDDNPCGGDGRSFREPALRFSVVIPTYQRRDLVVGAVEAFRRQEFKGGFEVIVVVDGSTDGSTEALRSLETPFPLTVLEQPNRGAASARNRGAGVAQGELLLFLDDDMESHPDLLVEHDRSHRDGADGVFGHAPLHPASPPTLLGAAVGRWAETKALSLSRPGAVPTFNDLLTGQLSLRREIFRQLGGFDDAFTRHGSYGNEDLDLGHRLLRSGARVVFNPNAVSWQRYVVTARQYLRQWRQSARADVQFARKHPDQASELFAVHRTSLMTHRRLFLALSEVPGLAALLSGALRWIVVPGIDKGLQVRGLLGLFRVVRKLEYWRGLREAGGIPRPRPVRVLAYHAIADLSGDSVLGSYAVPPERFREQLDHLRRAGYRFVGADEFLRFLDGRGGLPRRPLLLTFDDCYESLVSVVLPLLRERGIPAIAFAVSQRVGGLNDWDVRAGARPLPLLDASGLRALARGGVEIAAHSRTHANLSRLAEPALRAETEGSIADLEALGISRSRFFAYPYGAHGDRVRDVVAATGVRAAFTMDPGRARRGQDRFRLPRIEIKAADTGWRFRWKVLSGGRLSP